MDIIFDEIERIREQYIKIGSTDIKRCGTQARAIILQHLPEQVFQTPVVKLKWAKSAEGIYGAANAHTFGNKIALPRDQASPRLYLIGNQTTEEDSTNEFANIAGVQNNSNTNAEGEDNTHAQRRADGNGPFPKRTSKRKRW